MASQTSRPLSVECVTQQHVPSEQTPTPPHKDVESIRIKTLKEPAMTHTATATPSCPTTRPAAAAESAPPTEAVGSATEPAHAPLPAPDTFCYQFADQDHCTVLPSWARLRTLVARIGTDRAHAWLVIQEHQGRGLTVQAIGDAPANKLCVELMTKTPAGVEFRTLLHTSGRGPMSRIPTSAEVLTRQPDRWIPIRDGLIDVPSHAILPADAVVDAARHWLQHAAVPGAMHTTDWVL